MHAAIGHVESNLGLIVLIELLGADVSDGEEMRNNSDPIVLLAILPQPFFDLLRPQSHVQGLLADLLTVHEVHYAPRLFVVVLALHLAQDLEVTRLIFGRIVFDVPKLSLCLNRREVELWELLLLLFDAPADIRAVLEGFTEKRLNDTWDLQIWKDQRTGFQGSLQRRNQDDVWLKFLVLLPRFDALGQPKCTSCLPLAERWQSM